MEIHADNSYYTSQAPALLERFDRDASYWQAVLDKLHDAVTARSIIADARRAFENLIPELPYIGGAGNHLTGSLIWSAQCLALHQAQNARGISPAETGKILYDAILMKASEPGEPIPASEWLTPEELMDRRKERADRSQLREFPEDWVYSFVGGDGETFDYGYDFTECASQKFYQTRGAEDFLPYYCFLDYAHSEVEGLGLFRTKTLAEGDSLCNHRFKQETKNA